MPGMALGDGGGGVGLLARYEAIEQTSADMLQAALRGDWAQVARLEGACGDLIAQLRLAAEAQALAPEQRKARLRILQRILLNDAQIRHLAHPGQARVDALLSGRAFTAH